MVSCSRKKEKKKKKVIFLSIFYSSVSPKYWVVTADLCVHSLNFCHVCVLMECVELCLFCIFKPRGRDQCCHTCFLPSLTSLTLFLSLAPSPPLWLIPVTLISRHGNPVPACLTDKWDNEVKHSPPGQTQRTVCSGYCSSSIRSQHHNKYYIQNA